MGDYLLVGSNQHKYSIFCSKIKRTFGLYIPQIELSILFMKFTLLLLLLFVQVTLQLSFVKLLENPFQSLKSSLKPPIPDA